MFVVRYLMVAVALVAGIILWGVAADLGLWPILWLVSLAVLALQAGVLVLVLVAVLAPRPRGGGGPDPGGPQHGVPSRLGGLFRRGRLRGRGRGPGPYLVILPK